MSGEARSAALVAVGDELLSGATADTNSAWLARELGRLGIAVESVEVVPDDEPAVAAAVVRASARADLVTVTGGLGPTLDDVTRHGVALAFERELFEDDAALAEVRAWFDGRGVAMSATNRRQALLPRGAVRLRNRAGTAPGFRMDVGSGAVVVLPGPPRELQAMWNDEVLPWLAAKGWAGPALDERRFHLFGVPESVFAERVGEWMARDADPRMGCTVREGVLTASLRARERTAESRAALERRAGELRARFTSEIFSAGEWDLEFVLGRALLASRTTIATAESCTGGLVAGLLTRVPGISAVFGQGHVVYSDLAKCELLGVAPELLAHHGAVSREVAEAMATGAARVAAAELAVAVTGIAGPGGGTPEKPVGLVCFATTLAGEVQSVERRFPPSDRDAIRRWATRAALFLAWKRLRDAGRASASLD